MVIPTERVLCGRRDARGNYACTGWLATVATTSTGRRYAIRPGYHEDPPGSHRWVPTPHSRRLMARGQAPAWKNARRGPDGKRLDFQREAATPARVECPHCRCIAVLD